ncbi:DNA-directed RNA polymerase subunit alpha [Candidatus Parcubacteria bacterium]|nr:MAG: DNA-directed RNA polymerase subunit alpha [Candidatus Parcubacteria bacterium]
MIPLPSQPKIIREDSHHAVFEIEGLWPGYGHTIGNAIRRVLLSSLEGAAITAVKIEGASHEFSTLPGVLEDLIEVMLNLKQVRFRIHGSGPYSAKLAIKGDKEVTAGDLEVPSQLELVNPNHHIATLTDKKSNLVMELVVERGVGYQPVESRRKEKVEIGTIALDAAFSPVKLVNYEVENMRVGDRTDYNRVRFHIETDGSISARDAFSAAAKILHEQFGAMAGGLVEPEKPAAETAAAAGEEAAEESDSFEEQVLKKHVEDLELSTRTLNALNNAGIKNVGALAKKSEKKLREVEGLGDKGLVEIKRALGNMGLTLKQ